MVSWPFYGLTTLSLSFFDDGSDAFGCECCIFICDCSPSLIALSQYFSILYWRIPELESYCGLNFVVSKGSFSTISHAPLDLRSRSRRAWLVVLRRVTSTPRRVVFFVNVILRNSRGAIFLSALIFRSCFLPRITTLLQFTGTLYLLVSPLIATSFVYIRVAFCILRVAQSGNRPPFCLYQRKRSYTGS